MAPPLYYMVLHIFLSQGSNEFLVRLPSVIFFVFSIIACFLVAKTLFDKTVALTATFFFALSPLQITYAQEARMYSMCQLFLLLSFYFLIQALNTKKKKFWIAYILATSLSAYTHYFAIFYIVVQAIFLILVTLEHFISKEKRKHGAKINLLPLFWFTLSIICIFILYFPRMPSALARSHGAGLTHSFSDVFNLCLNYFGGNKSSIIPSLFGILFVWGLTACWMSKKKREGLLLGLWGVLPIPMTYFFLLYAESFFSIRYVLFSLVPYLIGISIGLIYLFRTAINRFRISERAKKIVYICMVLGITLVHIGPIQAMYNQPKQPWREMAQFFNEQVENDEIIVVSPRWYIVNLEYYGFQSDKFVISKFDNIERLFKNKSPTWVLCSPTPHFHPTRAFRSQIESGKCIKIFGETYPTAGLLLFYIRSDEDKKRDLIPILEAAINIVPKSWYLNALLAEEYKNKGNIRRAIFNYEKALNIQPKKVIFMTRLAQLYVEEGNFKPGIRLLRQAVNLRPNNAKNHILLADILVQAGNFNDALIEYNKAAELNPDFHKKDWFYVRLGNLYRLTKDIILSIDAYEKALALNNNNETALKWLKKFKQ